MLGFKNRPFNRRGRGRGGSGYRGGRDYDRGYKRRGGRGRGRGGYGGYNNDDGDFHRGQKNDRYEKQGFVLQRNKGAPRQKLDSEQSFGKGRHSSQTRKGGLAASMAQRRPSEPVGSSINSKLYEDLSLQDKKPGKLSYNFLDAQDDIPQALSRQEYRGKQRAELGQDAKGFGNFKKIDHQQPPSTQGQSFSRGNKDTSHRGFKIYQQNQDEDQRPNRNFNKREDRYQEAPQEFNSYPENADRRSSNNDKKGFERNFDGMNNQQNKFDHRGGRDGGRGRGRGRGGGYNRRNNYESRGYDNGYGRGGNDYKDVNISSNQTQRSYRGGGGRKYDNDSGNDSDFGFNKRRYSRGGRGRGRGRREDNRGRGGYGSSRVRD